MIRTFVLFASVISAHAATATVQECTTYMTDMTRECASAVLPNPPTAASVDGLCSVSVGTSGVTGCGYYMAKLALKCDGVSGIPSANTAIIDGALTVTKCCMKDDSTFKTAALMIDTSATENPSACWTGDGNSAAFASPYPDTTTAASLAAVAVALGSAAGSGSGNGAGAGAGGAGSAGATNTSADTTTAAPSGAGTASDAGKASLAMAVMAGVTMLQA